ncbi:uncharacterized protein B0H18DRAFT_1123651 [Fomitopsis serialis]|uniref:uncharacterized protein n=1 Tax=Fomitopsis serialis TaxID=139415 RepID=UPI002008347C|nr:uncharacterized protein B0H18DRAFT_1123651 [Neoantrodia serialis]KAH9917301.1 hypothetical protein B0H18DRAFT_1123651 [Neoantrodia serialis]
MEAQISQTALPPELWDHVVNELSDDRLALQACGLTRRVWVASTRRHLFRAIELEESEGCERFRDILVSSSSVGTGVARYVYDVTLRLVRLRLDVPEDAEASDIPLLEETLSRLPNVDRLQLFDVNVKYRSDVQTNDGLDQGHPDRPLRSLLTLPKLRTLCLTLILFDSPFDTMFLLAAFPQVSSLQLRNLVQMGGVPTRWRPQLPGNMCIRGLDVADVDLTAIVPFLNMLRHPPFICALQKLTWLLYPRADEVSLLMEMVGEAEGTLEELEIRCAPNSDLFEKMDLSQHSRLKSLRVKFSKLTNDAPPPFHHSLPSFLSRTSNNLRALHLSVDSSLFPHETPPWPLAGLPSLDEALTRLHKRNPYLARRYWFRGYPPLCEKGFVSVLYYVAKDREALICFSVLRLSAYDVRG